MGQTKFTSIKVRGQNIDLFVNNVGKFSAVYKGEDYEAPSIDQLTKKLNNATKKPISIPFYRWHETKGLQHGVIVGVHAGNRNVMIKLDGDKSIEQDRGWYGNGFLSMTLTEAKQYTELKRQVTEIENLLEEFEGAHKFHGREAAEKALGIEESDD